MQTQTTKAGVFLINPHGTPYVAITTDINAEEIANGLAQAEVIGWEHFKAEPTPTQMIERLVESGQAAHYPKDYNVTKVIAHSPKHGSKTLWLEVVTEEEHLEIMSRPRNKDGNITLGNGVELEPQQHFTIEKKTKH